MTVEVPQTTKRPLTSTSGHYRQAQQPAAVLPAGTPVGERFIICQFLARGGFADVYAAVDWQTGARVALKVARLPRRSDNNEFREAVERFARERVAYRRLSARCLPKYYGSGCCSDGTPFIVLELIEGGSLARRLRQGPLSISGVIELGRQLYAALDELHEQGIVHCDIKPGNILLQPCDGRVHVRLVDLGGWKTIADSSSDDKERVTGTLPYMAPEQILGGPVDERTDLYSAAVVLYRSLCGTPPYTNMQQDYPVRDILQAPLVLPSLLRASCPKELEQLMCWGLERVPSKRPTSARELSKLFALMIRVVRAPSSDNVFTSRPSQPPPRPSGFHEHTTRQLKTPLPHIPELVPAE